MLVMNAKSRNRRNVRSSVDQDKRSDEDGKIVVMISANLAKDVACHKQECGPGEDAGDLPTFVASVMKVRQFTTTLIEREGVCSYMH